MSDAIIVALITACATIVTQFVINSQNKKEMSISQAVRDKDVDDRLGAIEKRLSEHNSYAEKFASLTTAIVAMQKDIEYLKEK